jgi:hypothetical protein
VRCLLWLKNKRQAADTLISAANKISGAQEKMDDALRNVNEKEAAVAMRSNLVAAEQKVAEKKLDAKMRLVKKQERLLEKVKKDVVAKINGGVEEMPKSTDKIGGAGDEGKTIAAKNSVGSSSDQQQQQQQQSNKQESQQSNKQESQQQLDFQEQAGKKEAPLLRLERLKNKVKRENTEQNALDSVVKGVTARDDAQQN